MLRTMHPPSTGVIVVIDPTSTTKSSIIPIYLNILSPPSHIFSFEWPPSDWELPFWTNLLCNTVKYSLSPAESPRRATWNRTLVQRDQDVFVLFCCILCCHSQLEDKRQTTCYDPPPTKAGVQLWSLWMCFLAFFLLVSLACLWLTGDGRQLVISFDTTSVHCWKLAPLLAHQTPIKVPCVYHCCL